jgi:23S rRNA (cytosine1962-C5)-methyltransferase
VEQIRIDKRGEESIVSGHLWVFSNEVKQRSVGLPEGELVEVLGEKDRFLGIGTYNPRSLIALRLLSRERERIDEAFFVQRIEEALKLRADRFGESFRVVNSESDFLPGLVADKYNDQLVVQLLTAGMERQKEPIIKAITRVIKPEAIVLRNDSPSRKEEGLSQYVEVAAGEVEKHTVISVGPLRFLIDVMSGHKTGFYLDQRENHFLMADFASGKTVLDCFSYTGGFGLYALYFGAGSVTFVDASAPALELCRENMKLNRLTGGVFVKADGFDFMKNSTDLYDLIVLDPPSFIKSKKKLKEGEKGYIDLNKKALRRLFQEGHLFTFSCSHNMRRSRFRDMVRVAGYGTADIYLVKELSQSGDHPVLLTIPETDYLKGLVLRVRKRAQRPPVAVSRSEASDGFSVQR